MSRSDAVSGNAVLWAPILLPPVIWFVCMWANFALAPWACAFGWKLAMFIVSAAGLVITAALSLTAWNRWRSAAHTPSGAAADAEARVRIMAVLGFLIAALSFLVVLAQLVPVLMMGACQ